jgi:hypothetical protein
MSTQSTPAENSFSRANQHLKAQVPPISPAPARSGLKQREPFIPTFPVAVLDQLLVLPGKKDGYVYLILLWRCKVEKKNPVVLTSARLAQHGISRIEKWRALCALEQAGLIKVRRRSRKNPLVTLLGEKLRS